MVATLREGPWKRVTLPSTSFNANIFSFVAPSGMVALLLPKGEREAFLEKYQTKLFDGYGLVEHGGVGALLRNVLCLLPDFEAKEDRWIRPERFLGSLV